MKIVRVPNLVERVQQMREQALELADGIRNSVRERDIRGTMQELLLMNNDARAQAFAEVLKAIDEEAEDA